MMKITVTKSNPALVGPSAKPVAPTPIEHINLSSFDKPLAFFPMALFHVFNVAIPEPAKTVRRALSHALVHYFPVAGRLVGKGGGDLRIACTDEGVAFVRASAPCSLAGVKLLDPPFGAALLKELTVSRGAEGFSESDPLLFVQVTEFYCGGFVLGVTRNHAIADGTGFAQFLRAVGELARGSPKPAVLPVSCGDDSLPELPPWVKRLEEALVKLQPQDDLAYLDITVPSRCVNRIKAGFAAACEDEPCTVLEAVVAVLWQCRTRVVMASSDDREPLLFPVNVREQVGARPGYYGNCITSVLAVPSAGEVANGDINDLVKMIKRAKKSVSFQFDSSSNLEQLDAGVFGYNAFVVTSWRNLGADAVNLGGGTPARVMCRMERPALPNCVACLPCKAKDGANVLAACVKQEHVHAFLQEIAMITV